MAKAKIIPTPESEVTRLLALLRSHGAIVPQRDRKAGGHKHKMLEPSKCRDQERIYVLGFK